MSGPAGRQSRTADVENAALAGSCSTVPRIAAAIAAMMKETRHAATKLRIVALQIDI
jgi:hypothetical protein